MRRSLLFLASCLVMSASVPVAAEAQLDRLRRAAERAVDRQVDRMIGDAIACALGDTRCVDEARENGQPVVIVDDEGEPIRDANGNTVSDPDEAANLTAAPGEGVWRNYDFVPGHTVWRATDFTDERVGRFPANQLEFVNGNMQIVEMNGKPVLEASSESVFRVRLPEALPEGFAIEFSLKLAAGHLRAHVATTPLEGQWRAHPGDYLEIYHTAGVARAGAWVSQTPQQRLLVAELTPVKLQVDGDYAVMYVGSERVANVPTANFPRGDAVEFHLTANNDSRAYLSDIVVSVGLDDLYTTLTEEGMFTTRGILFDVGSAVLRPESTPVLGEILRTLERHEDLGMIIEGHTDSTGNEGDNAELSQARAGAVVEYLVSNGVDASRLEAVGRGESEPVADNATPEGRQQNRRVVLKPKA